MAVIINEESFSYDYDELLEIAHDAKRDGFDSVWCSRNIFHPIPSSIQGLYYFAFDNVITEDPVAMFERFEKGLQALMHPDEWCDGAMLIDMDDIFCISEHTRNLYLDDSKEKEYEQEKTDCINLYKKYNIDDVIAEMEMWNSVL